MKKSDLEILRNIKREEAQTRTRVAETVAADTGISFDVWWAEVAKALKIPAYLKEVVWTDFKSRGLTKTAPKPKFEEALRAFGYRF